MADRRPAGGGKHSLEEHGTPIADRNRIIELLPVVRPQRLEDIRLSY